MTTKWPVEDEARNLWAQIVRGLFGVIRICEHYVDGWTDGCPTDDLRKAAQRCADLAERADTNKLTDPDQPTYDKTKPC